MPADRDRVREDGVKELLAVEDGYRESTESWAGRVSRSQAPRPERAQARRRRRRPRRVGGAARRVPGAGSSAAGSTPPGTCIDCLPKRLQSRAKGLLGEIIEAPTRRDAGRALEVFREEYGAKYPKALAKLDRDWKPLTAFYDYPAEHWRHLRTTNPIESSFATVRLRTRVTKGAGSKAAALAMAYKLLGVRAGTLATVQRPRARRRRPRRREVQGRHQGHRRRKQRRWNDGREGRRLIILHCQIHNI